MLERPPLSRPPIDPWGALPDPSRVLYRLQKALFEILGRSIMKLRGKRVDQVGFILLANRLDLRLPYRLD